ncbi:MAG: adenylosuccinate synthetase [Neptunomonas phycophila]|uniref:adenylosuccinate synthetase n=1 Tax=Neptunomonas phycophila TaxID=1572645 RepID=UPI003B8B03CF
MKFHVVIGANFGDEGKGLTTDYLCRQHENVVVVRFNGGSQAGHTVTTPDGVRHVFKHIGSGAFANAATYLSEHFVVNPSELIRETTKLVEHAELIEDRRIFIHPTAKVTTPYDVMINWALEDKRKVSHSAHGSCGFGIGQTEERHESIQLLTHQLDNPDVIRSTLRKIRDEYYKPFVVKHRLSGYLDESFNDDQIIEDFIAHCHMMLEMVYVADYTRLVSFDHIVCEGAQGLLLDQEHKWFPHVTRSNTGLTNVEEIYKQINHENLDPVIDVYYISRSYLTRHGNGPLPFECEGKIYSSIVDNTNFTNHYQGALRFAPLNLDLLRESISNDIENVDIEVNTTLVVTCFNQLPNTIQYIQRGYKNLIHSKDEFIDILNNNNVCASLMISSSPDATSFTMRKSHDLEPA